MRSKIFLILLLLCLTAAAVYSLARWLPHREEMARLERIERYWEREYSRLEAADMDPRLIEHLREGDFPDATARIDAVRSLVHELSIRKKTTGIEKHGDTVSAMFAELLQNPEAPRPHLLCDHQANIMIAILDALGFQARLVHAFSSRGAPELHDHSFLEVRNPDTGSWEIQDPYDDVYWVHLETGRRACLLELVMNDPRDYAPCRGGDCDWSLSEIDRKRRDFFQALVWDFSREKRRSVCIVNSRRFDLEAVFDEPRISGKPYRGFLEKWIDPLVIVQ